MFGFILCVIKNMKTIVIVSRLLIFHKPWKSLHLIKLHSLEDNFFQDVRNDRIIKSQKNYEYLQYHKMNSHHAIWSLNDLAFSCAFDADIFCTSLNFFHVINSTFRNTDKSIFSERWYLVEILFAKRIYHPTERIQLSLNRKSLSG